MAALLAMSCGNAGGSEPDPDEEELRAVERAAAALDQSGPDELAALGLALETRLTADDMVVLARTHTAFVDALSSGTRFVPSPAFYALVDRLRDLPIVGLLPETRESVWTTTAATLTTDGALTGPPLGRRHGALYLNTLKPRCGVPCALQVATWTTLDLGLTTLDRFYGGLVASGVDCAKALFDTSACLEGVPTPCGQSALAQTLGDCAAFLGDLSLEVSGVSKAKQAYALSKLVIGLWGAGSLAVSAQGWVESCWAHQRTDCAAAVTCADDARACVATNGAGTLCCPKAESCVSCGACALPCGDTCCALGQRCDGGVCTSCKTGCGSGCCLAGEYCPEPESGTCEACDAPCGDTCCAPGTSCSEATGTCCETPCGASCCGEGEACLGAPPSCCDRPCGDECCDPDQVCDAAGGGCVSAGGCGDAPAIDCSALCAKSAQDAADLCAAKGGVLTPLDVPACVASCKCKVNAVPNLADCLRGLSCAGCDRLESAMETCGQIRATCTVTWGQ